MKDDKGLSNRRNCSWFFWLLALSVIALIALFSTGLFSFSHTERLLGPLNYKLRRLAHVVEYACLFLVLRLALSKTLARLGSFFHALTAILICAAVATADEWHQSLVPTRTGSWTDVQQDMKGAGVGLVIWLVCHITWKLWLKFRASRNDA